MSGNLSDEITERAENAISIINDNLADGVIAPEIEVEPESPIFRKGKLKLEPQVTAPGFWETLGKTAIQHNEFVQGAKFLGKGLPDFAAPNYRFEEIPEGWTAAQVENIIDLNSRYWGYVTNSKSPRDLLYRREKSLQAQADEQRTAMGGIVPTLIGSGIGIATSPSTYLLPMIGAAKYANFSEHVLKGIAKNIAPLAGQSLVHESIVQAGRFQGTAEDAVVDAIRDTVFGLGFYAGGRIISHGGSKFNLWASRSIVNKTFEGVQVKVKVDPLTGIAEGMIAEGAPGISVPTEIINHAQQFLDNGAVFDGIGAFAIGKIGQIPVLGSPLVKGLTFPRLAVRKFYNLLGNESIITGAIERGQARQTTAAELVREYSGMAHQATFDMQALYLQSLGLNPTLVGSAKAFIKQFRDGISSTRAEFDLNVAKTLSSEVPSLSKEVNEAAKIFRDLTDKIYTDWLEVKGHSKEILPPRNAQGYLTQFHNLTAMAKEPTRWVETVTESLRNQDSRILAIQEPLNNLKEELKELQIIAKHAKGKKAIAYKEQIKQARLRITKENERLIKLMREGKIPLDLLEGRPSATEVPKFRKVYDGDFSRQEAARAYYDSIKNLTPEQTSQAILGKFTGTQTPNVAMERMLLIPQMDLLNAGFLVTDMDKILSMYSRSLGKQVAIGTIFNDLHMPDGTLDLAHELNIEHDMLVARAIENITDPAKQQKELLRLDRERDKGISMINKAYNAFMGNVSSSKDFQRFGKTVRNFTSVSMLRNVPLLQIGELGGIVFKQRLWPFVTGGFIPLIKQVNSRIAREKYSANASHALAGMEITVNKMSSALFEPSVYESVPGSWVEHAIEKSAKVAPAVFGTNMIANEMQKLSANITQSRVMGDLFLYSQGKLSKADIKRLLINGIDPKKDAAIFIEQFNTHNGSRIGLGYDSNWYGWSNLEAATKMRRAIQNDIQGSILQAGVLDKPFWTRDPIVGLPFQFMGYVFAAFNKFTVPLAQSPDASKILGMMIMLSYGAMVEPLRKWEKGEPFEIDSEKKLDQWFVQGLLESGVMGYAGEYIEMIDSILDVPFLDRYKQDKFRRRTWLGILGGPAGGAVQNVLDVATMFIHGKINEKDLMKIRNMSGVPIPFWLDAFITRGIKSAGFPETKGEADYYSFIDRD